MQTSRKESSAEVQGEEQTVRSGETSGKGAAGSIMATGVRGIIRAGLQHDREDDHRIQEGL